MGLKLVDLLRWSKEVVLKDGAGQPIIQNGHEVKVWMRIIGDQDLEDSYKAARAASRRHRKFLQNRDSDEFMAGISIILEADHETCKILVSNGYVRNFNSEAFANVERPELPKIEEIAIDADAPTLEEQERLDTLTEEVNKGYLDALDQYVTTKKDALSSELDLLSLEDIRERAIEAMVDVLSMEVFLKELDMQKTSRSVYMDKTFKESAFDDVEDFRQFKLNDFLISEYSALELNSDDVKN